MHHSRSLNYMPGLDGLRTLAVFAVIAYHMNYSWASGGLLGVNLFFVLSGYLITNILFSQMETLGQIDLKDFWIRRARRLLPALFLMLAGLTLMGIFFAPERIGELKHEALAVSFYVGNWYLIFHELSYFESFGPPSPLGHLWSLAIEEQFYIFWPLILSLAFRFLKTKKKIVIGTMVVTIVSALAMALIYIPGMDPSRVYYGTDTRAFALLLGSIAAMLLPRKKMSNEVTKIGKNMLDATGIICLAAIIWMIVASNQYQPFLYQGGLFVFSLVATIFVITLAHPAGLLGKLFGWKPLKLLGQWSYGIYLWHYPVIILSSSLTNTDGPNPLLSLIQLAVSILLAALSFYLIEEPVRHRKITFLALCSRVPVSLILIVAVMAATSMGGMQILATDLEAGLDKDPDIPVSEGFLPDDEGPLEGKNLPEGEDQAEGEVSQDKPLPEDQNLESGEGITIISDSLLIDAKPMMEENLPGIVIDTLKGRQMYDAPQVIDQLRADKKLGETVVIALGSNGAFTEKQLMKTLDCLEGVKYILLINTRVPKPWEPVVNEMMEKVLKSYSEVELVDWYGTSKGHGDYFYQDGVHLNQRGMDAYYEMLLGVLSHGK